MSLDLTVIARYLDQARRRDLGRAVRSKFIYYHGEFVQKYISIDGSCVRSISPALVEHLLRIFEKRRTVTFIFSDIGQY